ncbi:hypothetical protein BDV95DRAFT_308536 [Massariosphaeria phaeospora]|uniref:Uncharacterized protein n=1 Tax=Massariosphaeria phaeospora TaxID=100035 RepID=A0A7C8IEH2_9PLEO|nr:hypothetical protein BDV95DRAFT_308536 [Massariosphaeria phaeospora]
MTTVLLRSATMPHIHMTTSFRSHAVFGDRESLHTQLYLGTEKSPTVSKLTTRPEDFSQSYGRLILLGLTYLRSTLRRNILGCSTRAFSATSRPLALRGSSTTQNDPHAVYHRPRTSVPASANRTWQSSSSYQVSIWAKGASCTRTGKAGILPFYLQSDSKQSATAVRRRSLLRHGTPAAAHPGDGRRPKI